MFLVISLVVHINKKQNMKQSIVLHIFNALTFHAQGILISFQSTIKSLEMHVLTALPLSADAVFTQETCSLISDSEKNMWHTGIQGIYRSYRLEATQINTDDQHFY